MCEIVHHELPIAHGKVVHDGLGIGDFVDGDFGQKIIKGRGAELQGCLAYVHFGELVRVIGSGDQFQNIGRSAFLRRRDVFEREVRLLRTLRDRVNFPLRLESRLNNLPSEAVHRSRARWRCFS